MVADGPYPNTSFAPACRSTWRRVGLILISAVAFGSCSQGTVDRSLRSSSEEQAEKSPSKRQGSKKKNGEKGEGGGEKFKQGQPSVPIAGVNLVNFHNARARCDYESLGEEAYKLLCHAAAVRPDGSEVKAVGLADGVSLAWQDPEVLEGRANEIQCATRDSSLGFSCDVRVASNGELTKLKVKMDVSEGSKKRKEESVVTLPYAVGVSAGFVPNVPFRYQDVGSTQEEESTRAETEGEDNKPVGFQKFDFPATAYQVYAPRSVCFSQSDDSLYFVHAKFVYRIKNERVTLYAGSGQMERWEDLSHRVRTGIWPTRIACAEEGIYISEAAHNRILLARPDGRIERVAGTGSPRRGGDGSVAAEAPVDSPWGVAVSPEGELYFSEKGSNQIRKVTTKGRLATVAGTGAAGYSGDGGAAKEARLTLPQDLRFTDDGALYISEYGNHVIRKIAPDGTITTFAGTGVPRYETPNDDRALAEPMGLDVGPMGNVYVSELFRGVKRISPSGGVTTLREGNDIGENAADLFYSEDPADNAELDGLVPNQILAIGPNRRLHLDSGSGIVAVSSTGESTTIVGAQAEDSGCGDSSPAAKSRLFEASSLDYLADGSLVYADWKNLVSDRFRLKTIFEDEEGNLRKKDLYGCDGNPLFVGSNTIAEGKATTALGGMTAYDGAYYVTNAAGNVFFKVDAEDGSKTVIAGDGTSASTGDGGPASEAQLASPVGVDVGPDGDLYFVEYASGKVRTIEVSTGTISTVAGTGTPGDSGEGGPADEAQIAATNLAVADDGSIFLADYENRKVKRIDAQTGNIETIAGNGTFGITEKALDATEVPLGKPVNLDVTNAGTVIFVDRESKLVQELEQNDSGTWQLSTLFGKKDGGRDCGVGTLEGSAKANNVDEAIKNSLSIICSGEPRAVTVEDTCPGESGQTKIAISQGFREYANIIEIVRPCAED